ncbi:MAG TPA: YciI family protein [Acidobacteriaceae bacterium]
MRFMLIVIPKGYENATPSFVPDAEMVAKMMEYNKSLQKAGVLLALDGLLPPSTAARVSYKDGKVTVTDGPFAEAKEAIGGYWIIQVRSREEAIEWAKRVPASSNGMIEVRQIQEMADFPEDVRKAAEGFEKLPNAAAAKA